MTAPTTRELTSRVGAAPARRRSELAVEEIAHDRTGQADAADRRSIRSTRPRPSTCSAWARRIRAGESGVLPVIGGLIVIVDHLPVDGVQSSSPPATSPTCSSRAAPFIMLGMAEVFVLLLGEIDLSVGFRRRGSAPRSWRSLAAPPHQLRLAGLASRRPRAVRRRSASCRGSSSPACGCRRSSSPSPACSVWEGVPDLADQLRARATAARSGSPTR